MKVHGKIAVVLAVAVLLGFMLIGTGGPGVDVVVEPTFDVTVLQQQSYANSQTEEAFIRTPDVASISLNASRAPNAKYLDTESGDLRGNRRCIVPLLLTDTKYHGTKLLATTIKGWILKLFVPQKSFDLVIYYDSRREGLLRSIVDLLSLKAAAAVGSFNSTFARSDVFEALTEADRTILIPSSGYFTTPHHPTFMLRIVPTTVPYPAYIQREPSLLNRSDWMRCGCPPYCPVKRATESYIQGTRWYTYDMFLEPTIAPYSYWMKIDVDIWLFRELNVNVIDEMISKRALVAHTGAIFNGGGCSNNLHQAILEYHNCSYEPISRQPQGRRQTICDDGRIVSAAQNWWKQDDGVYYTNFVVYSVHFFLDNDVMALSHYLNEYKDGFFRYRWTDQSLAHKVFGVFAGPDEDMFRLDWSHLRWKRGKYRSTAAFWHGKSGKSKKDLSKYTSLTKDVLYYR